MTGPTDAEIADGEIGAEVLADVHEISRLLWRAADRSRTERYLVGSLIAAYQQALGAPDWEIMAILNGPTADGSAGGSPEMMARAMLCRRPRQAHWEYDTEQIARASGAHLDRLRRLIRDAQEIER
jgi:hypothetical protein